MSINSMSVLQYPIFEWSKVGMSNKVNIVACGGFGQNIMILFSEREVFRQLHEHLNLIALDTSPSNLKRFAGKPIDDVVTKILVPNVNGSGKYRAENYEQIVSMTTELVNSDQLSEGLTILISSGSGGSGAVTASELQQLLGDRGRPVLAMMLGTDEDATAVENTLKSVKTLQHKAGQGKKNFTLFYGSNRFPDPKDEKKTVIDEVKADTLFVTNLEDLVMVGHPTNEDLDSKDIYNWLNFPIKQTEPGTVRFLSLTSRRESEDFPTTGEAPITALSLLSKRGITPQFPEGAGWTTRGYVTEGLAFVDDVVEVQYQLFAGKSAKLTNQLEQTLKTFAGIQEKQAEAAAGDKLKTSEKDKVSDSGTFL
jgi:hypothetical protein